ncbi:hypothetical protein CRUP_028266 [Coryphaenoides rupestris]|nr:hypothetical protein CRUP_028266 [Coryphaenoides rupestris]
MFKNSFQGGSVVEVFSAQGKDPVAKWKLQGAPASILKWCNLCIDLVSFTGEPFKMAAFQTLDGIAVCANCKLRRIFTMKAEPSDGCRPSYWRHDVIPRSCQFPRDVRHVTQMFSMAAAAAAARQTAATKLMNSDSAGSATPRKPPSSSHVAFGSRVSGPPPPPPPLPPQHARRSSRSQEELHARGPDLSLPATRGRTAGDPSVRSPDATHRHGDAAFEVIGEDAAPRKLVSVFILDRNRTE